MVGGDRLVQRVLIKQVVEVEVLGQAVKVPARRWRC